jgi:hypothetical protein
MPGGLPARVVEQIQHLSVTVFQHGYVRAVHPTLVLPIVAMLVAAACCLASQRQPGVSRASDRDPVPMANA